jgi:simple sugar transport system ATP-binding protein
VTGEPDSTNGATASAAGSLIDGSQDVGRAELPAGVPVLEMHNVSKRFGAVVACQDVDLQVFGGEIVALAGHNGAGKSTVLKMLSGVIQPDAGELRLMGKPAHLNNVRTARAHGIETVPQELALAPKLSVAANIFLGRELVAQPTFLGLRARRRMEEESARLLASLGVRIPRLRVHAGALSGGQAQAVAIARAVGWGRNVVVLDEPTAALGLRETQQVELTIARMRELGLAILIVSHDLDQMFRLADRIYVMYHGRVVGSERTAETTRERIGALIHGQSERATQEAG